MTSVKSIVNKAKKFYFQEWRGHEKTCPAFGEKIYVTRLGWNHIVHLSRRRLVDKIIRLKNFRVAKEILETATTYQTIEKRQAYYRYGLWAVKGNKRFKVVVSSKGKKGRKIFFSFMVSSLSKREQIKTLKHNQKLVHEFRKKNPLRKKRRKK